MPYASKRKGSKEREMGASARNRRKIIPARLSGRDLMRMVLPTSAGLLITIPGEPTGLQQIPPIPPFVEPLFIPPIAQPLPQP
jgi:hypothetical protein